MTERSRTAYALAICGSALLVAFRVAGCAILPTHLHDPGKAASAAKLKSELDAYTQNAPFMYQAMLANLQKFKLEEDRLIADLAANRDKALVTLLPSQNQTQLGKHKDQVKARITELESAIREQANRYLKEKGLIQKELSDARQAIQKAKEAVAAAKTDVTTWNATVALLQKGIAELPSIVETTTKQRAKDGVNELAKTLKDVGEKEVEFKNADQKIQKKKIRHILSEEVHGRDTGKSILNLPDAPGITVMILTFGLELAEIQQKAAVTRLTQLSRRAELYEDSLAEELLAAKLLSETNFGVLPDISIYNNLQRLAVVARAMRQGGNMQDVETSQAFFLSISTILGSLQDLRKLVLADSKHQELPGPRNFAVLIANAAQRVPISKASYRPAFKARLPTATVHFSALFGARVRGGLAESGDFWNRDLRTQL